MPHVITHVSDTARWVAIYRAMESERPDAIFRDPYARSLGGPEGEAIVKAMPRGAMMAWPMIVRTALLDDAIARAVREGADRIVNLAAGLDTRPWRMTLPPSLRWVDVDLPPILAYKAEKLASHAPVCAYEAIAADLTDADARRATLARATTGARCTVVITEGLLVYLEDAQVADLARDIAAQPSVGEWLSDLASPRLLKMMMRSWGSKLAQGNAPFKFAPPNGTAFFETFGWKERDYWSIWEAAIRLGRGMPLMWLWTFLGRLQSRKRREASKRMSGVIALVLAP